MNKSKLSKTLLLFSLAFSLGACDLFTPEPVHEHSFSNEWSKNDSQHWHGTTCGHDEKKDLESHQFGEYEVQVPATDSAEGLEKRTCSVCGHEETRPIPMLPHTHTFSNEWSTSEFSHFHSSTCGHDVTTEKRPHVFGNTEIIQEIPETGYQLERKTCKVCGYYKEEYVPLHEHTYCDSWSYDKTTHYHGSLCEHDLKKDIEEHDFTDWEVTKQPNNDETGTETRNCKICGYLESRTVYADGHEHTFADAWSKDANTHYHASTCSHRYEMADRTPHTYGDWIVDSEPTESSTGLKHRICSVCDYRDELVTPKLKKQPMTHDSYVVEDYYDGYYSSIVSWTNGEDLVQQLNTLIRKNFTGLVYEGNWETNQMTEQCLDNFEKVNVVYSAKDDGKINTYGSGAAGASGWQREHAFCASLMTAYNTGEAVATVGNSYSRATDFHNLFAAYGAANGSRGNKNLGYYASSKETVSSAVEADSHSDNLNFEPNDVDKGRLARAIFYMGVMYNADEESSITVKYNYKDSNNNSKTKSVRVNAKYKPIQIVENYVDYSQITFTNFVSSMDPDAQNARNKYASKYLENTLPYASTNPDDAIMSKYSLAYSDYRYNEGKFAIGNLSTLLDWNSFAVDRAEMFHNETVYSYVHQNDGANKGKKQGNRNPFVDYPELVDYIYGDKKNEPGTLASLCPSEAVLDTGSKEISNYALTSHVSKYLVGQTLTSADYTFVRVNKDFSVQDADFQDINNPYTFVEGDIGQKTITLSTPTGDISYVVNVESNAGVNACNYKMQVSTDSFISKSVTTTPTKLLSFGGVDYNFSATNTCSVAKQGDYVKIGNGTSAQPGTLTIESSGDFAYEGKTNITGIYVGLNTASGKTYKLDIYVGESKILDTSFSYNKDGAVYYGADFDGLSGPIKIVISNADAAIHFSGISVNVN